MTDTPIRNRIYKMEHIANTDFNPYDKDEFEKVLNSLSQKKKDKVLKQWNKIKGTTQRDLDREKFKRDEFIRITEKYIKRMLKLGYTHQEIGEGSKELADEIFDEMYDEWANS